MKTLEELNKPFYACGDCIRHRTERCDDDGYCNSYTERTCGNCDKGTVPFDYFYRKQGLLRCSVRDFHVRKHESPCEQYKPLGTALMDLCVDGE